MSGTKLAVELLVAAGHEATDLGILEDPRWDEAGKCHDWRNHVHDAVSARWGDLDAPARAVAYIAAKCEADRENWD